MKYWICSVLLLVGLSMFTRTAHAEGVLDITFPVVGEVQFSDTFTAARSNGRVHNATDIMAAKMLPVLATVDGTILFAPMTQPSYGYIIMLAGDDGYQYNYVHLNNDTPGTDDGLGGPAHAYAEGIKKGIRVKRGQHIGYVGDSGNAERTAPHIHFEIYRGKTAVNPYASLLVAQQHIADAELSSASVDTTTINDDKGIVAATAPTNCTSDSLIRTPEASTVYYCGRDGNRYLFQNESTFFSWYVDFSDVTFVSADVMGSIPLRGTVTYKPGSVLVKLASTPKVYAVDANGTLRNLPTTDVAIAKYGQNWATLIQTLPDSFFPAYQVGEAITM